MTNQHLGTFAPLGPSVIVRELLFLFYAITDGSSGAKVPRAEIVLKFRKEIPIKTLVGLKKN